MRQKTKEPSRCPRVSTELGSARVIALPGDPLSRQEAVTPPDRLLPFCWMRGGSSNLTGTSTQHSVAAGHMVSRLLRHRRPWLAVSSSATTFLATALGSIPGLVDLGEVAPLKAAVPELVNVPPARAARRLRSILAIARRVGLVGSVRPVEQTPEMAYLLDVADLAYPDA